MDLVRLPVPCSLEDSLLSLLEGQAREGGGDRSCPAAFHD